MNKNAPNTEGVSLSIREIRLGNILSFVLPSRYCQVDYLEPNLIGSSPLGLGSDSFNAERGIKSFHPVPLSDSLLSQFQFTQNINGWFYQSKTWYLSLNTEGYELRLNNQVICTIQYVHHLQNIIFDLFRLNLCLSENEA